MIEILFLLISASLLIHLGFYGYFFFKFNQYTQLPKTMDNFPKVSIIVCFKNDISNIRNHLHHWLEQDYPNYEIVLMDDFSDPWNYDLPKDEKLKYFKVQIDRPGKKQALKEGIRKSSGEILLLTDADCVPNTKGWVSSMMREIQDQEIVLGYGPFFKKSSLLNRFQRYETFLTATQYMSYALRRIPYMGVGRNLAYRHHLVSNNADILNESMASGDDDLLIQKIATSRNTGININPESFVYSVAPETFKSYFRQKMRHHSTSTSYKTGHKILLSLYSGSQIMFWLGVLTASFIANYKFLIFLPIKWLCQYVFTFRIYKKFMESDLLVWLPFLDFFMFLYYVIFAPLLLITKSRTEWK